MHESTNRLRVAPGFQLGNLKAVVCVNQLVDGPPINQSGNKRLGRSEDASCNELLPAPSAPAIGAVMCGPSGPITTKTVGQAPPRVLWRRRGL